MQWSLLQVGMCYILNLICFANLLWSCFIAYLVYFVIDEQQSKIGCLFITYLLCAICEGFCSGPSSTRIRDAFDSLVQYCSISSALAMEILQFRTKPSVYLTPVTINMPKCIETLKAFIPNNPIVSLRQKWTFLYNGKASRQRMILYKAVFNNQLVTAHLGRMEMNESIDRLSNVNQCTLARAV